MGSRWNCVLLLCAQTSHSNTYSFPTVTLAGFVTMGLWLRFLWEVVDDCGWQRWNISSAWWGIERKWILYFSPFDQTNKNESKGCRFKLNTLLQHFEIWFNYRHVSVCVFVYADSFRVLRFLHDSVPVCTVCVCLQLCVSMCVFSATDDSRRAVLSAGRKWRGGSVYYFIRLP